MNTVMVIMGMIVLVINCITMILTFPGKRSLPFTIGVLLAFTVVFYAVLYLSGIILPDYGGLPGLAYLPVMVMLFSGKLLQKTFAYFLQFIFTSFQVAIAQTAGGFFAKFGDNVSAIVSLVSLFIMLTAYVVIMLKSGRKLFVRLFEYGRDREWAFYAFGAMFSFAVLVASQIAPGSIWHVFLVLFFIVWSFAVLCFAIISTHEKIKHQYEAEFVRDLIFSGSDHYQKMNEMYDALRIMRHDYKYHMDTISELLNAGDKTEAEKYVADIKKQMSEKQLPAYCSNSVLNALLAGYAERCHTQSTVYIVEISMPLSIAIPNYEMCIILGNLLENAIEASARLDDKRKIELVINTQGSHLAIMVKNRFDGAVLQDNSRPVTMKKDGGLGLRSVQAVAARYGGELMTEWDIETFTAYVLLSLKMKCHEGNV